MDSVVSILSSLVSFILHIDKHLAELIQQYHSWTYGILFLIVFCETGLVATPFLPGDSLLFAAGALTTQGDLNVHLLAVILIVAAILGDAVNYGVGAYIGPRVFEKKDSRIFRADYLRRTEKFFEKYGGKAIIFARFVPIVRTFAPFLAGVGRMSYARFALFNITGAVAWVSMFLYAGFFFGENPVVKKNFTLVIIAIIIISVIPALIEIVRARRESRLQVV